MSWLRHSWLLIFLGAVTVVSAQTQQQQDTGGAAQNTGNVTGIGTGVGSGANNTASGSSQVPEGFGGGGISENLNNFELGQRGTANQNEGFIGGNANAQQGGFVGQNQAFGNGGVNGNQFNAGGRFGNLGGFGAGGRAGGFGQQIQRRTIRQIRTRLVLPADVAAEYRVVPPVKLQNSLTKQYRAINATQEKAKAALGSSRVFANSNVTVTANGRTVTLRGQVGSDRERKLAERIALLEPGVDQVVNQLSVVAADP